MTNVIKCKCFYGFSDIDECKGNPSCHMNATCTFHFAVDPCYHYSNLSEANRNKDYRTPQFGPVFCDDQLFEGWYRFVGDAGTNMPTTRVSPHRCGTDWSGWLNGAHPTLEDGEVYRTVCFSDRSAGFKSSKNISVKKHTLPT